MQKNDCRKTKKLTPMKSWGCGEKQHIFNKSGNGSIRKDGRSPRGQNSTGEEVQEKLPSGQTSVSLPQQRTQKCWH